MAVGGDEDFEFLAERGDEDDAGIPAGRMNVQACRFPGGGTALQVEVVSAELFPSNRLQGDEPSNIDLLAYSV